MSNKKEILIVVLVCIIVSVSCMANAWPLLSGDRGGTFKPVAKNEEFTSIYSIIANDSEYSLSSMLPGIRYWTIPVPILNDQAHENYFNNLILQNKTSNLSTYFSAFGIKYLIVDKEQPNGTLIFENLASQSDFELLFNHTVSGLVKFSGTVNVLKIVKPAELIGLASNDYLKYTANAVTDGMYRFAISGNGKFELSINGSKFELALDDSGYVYTQPISLEHGMHDIIIKSAAGGSYLDNVWFYLAEDNETVEQILDSEIGIHEYEKVNPTLWRVNVSSDKPFMLGFAQRHNIIWEAQVLKDGKVVETVSPMPLYGMINGFWINETGDMEIVLNFKVQKWFDCGLAVSGIFALVIMIYLAYSSLKDWRRVD